MPSLRQLQWDELDLLQALQVIPTEGENGSLRYRVERDGLQLRVSLWPEHGLVDVMLSQTATRAILLDLTVAVRGPIRYNNDARGEYLEFTDCLLVSRLLASDEQLEAAFSPQAFGRPMQLTVNPGLSVLFE